MGEIVRAFELPLQSIEWDMSNREPMPADWNGWKLLRCCWDQARWLANWGVQQLLLCDAGQLDCGPGFLYTHGMTQGHYPHVGFWTGAKGSAADVLRSVNRKFREERGDVSRLQKIHSSYRSFPFPVRSQEWKEAGLDESGKPWVRVSLPGGNAILRMRGGPEFGRQMGHFREVVKGDRPRLQIQIREQRRNGTSHRPTVGGRDKSGNGVGSRVMVKMVAKLEAKERPGERCLVLATDPQAFWVAELDGRRAWVLNADHLHGFTVGHQQHLDRLQRMSEDGKAERRLRSGRVKGIASKVEAICLNHGNRMASLTHEAAANVVGFAVRNRCGEIFYLDRDKGFVPKFPWADLHGKLAAKCEVARISLYSESGYGVVAVQPEGGSEGVVDIQATTIEEDTRWARVTRLREMAARKVDAARRRKGSSRAVSAP